MNTHSVKLRIALFVCAVLGCMAQHCFSQRPQQPGMILAVQGDGLNRSAERFGDAAADVALISQVFNTVLLEPGDPELVRVATNRGLRVFLEFDYKWDFIQGLDIAPKVQRIVDQVRDSSNAITGIMVADRLNSWAEPAEGRPAIPPDKMVEYLRLTGGVFHKELPGILMFSDVEDQELTCGQPGQSRGEAIQPGSTSIYRYEKNDILVQLKDTGLVDGFFIADNIRSEGSNAWDVAVQRRAWNMARALLSKPFLIAPRTSRLSFYQDTYPFDPSIASRQTQVAVAIPLEEGADGADLWGWHIPWSDQGSPSIRTWLNKDGSTNVLWQELVNLSLRYKANR